MLKSCSPSSPGCWPYRLLLKRSGVCVCRPEARHEGKAVVSPATRSELQFTPVKVARPVERTPLPRHMAGSENPRARRQRGTGVFLPGSSSRRNCRSPADSSTRLSSHCSVESASSLSSELSSSSSYSSASAGPTLDVSSWSPFAGRSFDLRTTDTASWSGTESPFSRVSEANTFP